MFLLNLYFLAPGRYSALSQTAQTADHPSQSSTFDFVGQHFCFKTIATAYSFYTMSASDIDSYWVASIPVSHRHQVLYGPFNGTPLWYLHMLLCVSKYPLLSRLYYSVRCLAKGTAGSRDAEAYGATIENRVRCDPVWVDVRGG